MLTKAEGACEKGYGMWKIQPFFRNNFTFYTFFPLGVTGDFELKSFIKITKLKLKKRKEKTNSFLKKCQSSLCDPGTKRQSCNLNEVGTQSGDCLTA